MGRVSAGLAAAVAVVIAGAAVASAAKPIRGATYTGTIVRVVHVGHNTFRSTFTISFKVSKSGKRVSNFALPQGYPIYCQGGGFGTVQTASGSISKRGTFKVKLPIYFAPAHAHQGFVTVTGKFAARGKESGKVTTGLTHATVCDGSSSYTAKG